MRLLLAVLTLLTCGPAVAQDEAIVLPDQICRTNACASAAKLPESREPAIFAAMAKGDLAEIRRLGGTPKRTFESLTAKLPGGQVQMQQPTIEKMRNAPSLAFHTIAGVVVVAQLRSDGSVARYVAPNRPPGVEVWQVGTVMDLGDEPWGR
jgi:hypothetical protein